MSASSSRADSPDAALSSDGSYDDHESVSVSKELLSWIQVPLLSDYQLLDDELDGDSCDHEELEGDEPDNSESDNKYDDDELDTDELDTDELDTDELDTDELDTDELDTDGLDSDNSDNQIAGDESNVISVSYSPGQGKMVEKNDEGVFSLSLQLESPVPFSVLQTVTLMEGPLKDLQVILIKPRQPLHFLDLPREIRDEIYTYAMVPHTQCRASPSRKPYIESRIFLNVTEARPDQAKRYIPREVKTAREYGLSVLSSMFQGQEFTLQESVTPGLLTVNRQVYLEARQILYEKNTFQMQLWTVERFLARIGPADQQIRYLNVVHLGCYGVQRAKETLANLTHLKHLTLVGMPLSDEGERYSPFIAATELYRKMYIWIDCVGKLHGDRFAALERLTVQAGPLHAHKASNAYHGVLTLRTNFVAKYYSKMRLSAGQLEWDQHFREQLKALITLDNSNKTFQFLAIPRKLRDKIYQFAMQQEHHWNGSHENHGRQISIWQFLKTGRVRRRIQLYGKNCSDNFQFCDSLTPGLLLANRQIHDESKMILYGKNHFKFDREDTLDMFLSIIGSSSTLLRSVDIGTYPTNVELWSKLWHLDNLVLYHMPMYNSLSTSCTFGHQLTLSHLDWNTDAALDLDVALDIDRPIIRPDRAQLAAIHFFNKARSWIDGVGIVHQDKLSAVSRVCITISMRDRTPSVLNDRFRTELTRLIASEDGE
ncbi:hypothetical protein BFW01_g4582 [Lasiodiplodia theobromae]|nr:hypothetical protein BFW01_g4582 [Lasiodiplodia theobromae]